MKSILAGVLLMILNAYGSEAQKSAQTIKSESLALTKSFDKPVSKNVAPTSTCPLLQIPVTPDSTGNNERAPEEPQKEPLTASANPSADSVKIKSAEIVTGKDEPAKGVAEAVKRPRAETQPKEAARENVVASIDPKDLASKKSSKKPASINAETPVGTAKVSVILARALDGTMNDFSPVPYQNGIVYVSNSHKMKKGVKAGDPEDPEDYNLKYSEFDSTGALTKPGNFSRKLNTSKTHEGPVSFTKDGNTMFITRNTAFDDGKKRGKTTANLKIFIKTMVDGEWTGEETLPFETDHHNYCHPSLSADGTKLYFASDIPGGFGGMDIYMSRRLKDGSWTQPINMGPRVNTDKTELFPYISEKGTLFFSSNGRKGAAGLDLYRIEIDSRTARAVNMGEPFNSEGDDFGIMFMPGSLKKGYFSSNRPGGTGGDDIYQFEIK